jgi:hypothetical protein
MGRSKMKFNPNDIEYEKKESNNKFNPNDIAYEKEESNNKSIIDRTQKGLSDIGNVTKQYTSGFAKGLLDTVGLVSSAITYLPPYNLMNLDKFKENKKIIIEKAKEKLPQANNTGDAAVQILGELFGIPQVSLASKILLNPNYINDARKSIGIVKKIGTKLASLKSQGVSEKVRQEIIKNPEIILKPKESWQEIYTSAYDAIDYKKKVIGENIGFIRKEIEKKGISEVTNTKDLINSLENIMKEIPITDNLSKNSVKKMIHLVKNGAREIGTSEKRILSMLGIPFRPLQLDNLNIDQLGKVRDAANSIKLVNKLLAKKTSDLSSAENKVLNAYQIIKNKYNSFLDNIDEKLTSLGITKERNNYATLMQQKRISDAFKKKEEFGKVIRNSLKIDNEYKYDALKGLLTKDILDKSIGYLLNEVKEKPLHAIKELATPYGRTRGVFGAIGSNLESLGGVLSANKVPEYAINPIAKNLINIKNTVKPFIPGPLSTGLGIYSAGKNNLEQ